MRLQTVVFFLVAASVAYARPGYYGYPYGVVPHAGALPVPVHDTPEVAAAKAAHFAAVATASGAAGVYGGAYAGAHDDGQYHPGLYGDEGQYHGEGLVGYAGYAGYAGAGYAGAYAGAHDDGQYHPGLYGDEGQYHGEGYAGVYGHYAGPIAGVPLIVNGVPADTPEVAAAKAAHFAAHSHAAHYG